MDPRGVVKIKIRRKPALVRAEGVSLETKTVKKDTEKSVRIEEDRISLKALAAISAWNSYTSESWLRRFLNKLIRK